MFPSATDNSSNSTLCCSAVNTTQHFHQVQMIYNSINLPKAHPPYKQVSSKVAT